VPPLSSDRSIARDGEAAAIPAHAVGTVFGGLTAEMSLRRVTAFAAGIGANRSLHLDDARAGGVVAPPGIVAALEWPCFMDRRYLSAIDRTETSLFDGLVHGFEVSAFHRPIRPGDQLTTTGTIVAARSTPAGALLTSRLETADRDGPVATGWFGTLFRKAPLTGAGVALEELPPLRPEADLPDTVGTAAIAIRPEQAHVYTACADIWNPIHTERAYALASGLPDIVLHGSCTFAMAIETLAARLRPDDPLPFRRVGARFSSYVIPGETITLAWGAPVGGIVPFVVLTPGGSLALSHGFAELP